VVRPKKIIYGQQIDVSIAMIRLFGGEVLDDPSQDFNITSGSDIQEGNTNLNQPRLQQCEINHLHFRDSYPDGVLSPYHIG
jgi:hypothetical protein